MKVMEMTGVREEVIETPGAGTTVTKQSARRAVFFEPRSRKRAETQLRRMLETELGSGFAEQVETREPTEWELADRKREIVEERERKQAIARVERWYDENPPCPCCGVQEECPFDAW